MVARAPYFARGFSPVFVCKRASGVPNIAILWSSRRDKLTWMIVIYSRLSIFDDGRRSFCISARTGMAVGRSRLIAIGTRIRHSYLTGDFPHFRRAIHAVRSRNINRDINRLTNTGIYLSKSDKSGWTIRHRSAWRVLRVRDRESKATSRSKVSGASRKFVARSRCIACIYRPGVPNKVTGDFYVNCRACVCPIPCEFCKQWQPGEIAATVHRRWWVNPFLSLAWLTVRCWIVCLFAIMTLVLTRVTLVPDIVVQIWQSRVALAA